MFTLRCSFPVKIQMPYCENGGQDLIPAMVATPYLDFNIARWIRVRLPPAGCYQISVSFHTAAVISDVKCPACVRSGPHRVIGPMPVISRAELR